MCTFVLLTSAQRAYSMGDMDTANVISKDGIKYTVSRERDLGFETETNDCFVQALRHVLGVPYRDAHAYVATKFERKPRRGTHKVRQGMLAMVHPEITVFGYRVFDKAVPTRTTVRRSRRTWSLNYVQAVVYPTLATMMHTMRTGRYVVCSSNHAWAVIDGVVYDNGITRSGRRVTEVYEFIPSSKCDAMLVGQGAK